ncbi:MAG: ATP-binding cassette domain-containing protein, partial [Fibrobacterota bacterium]
MFSHHQQPTGPSPSEQSSGEPAVSAVGLRLGYGDREVVKEIDLVVPRGQFLVVLGPSGSGKSTLLLALNGSIPVLGGSLSVLGQNPSDLHGGQLERFREKIGFIFQSFHLVGRLPVLHNVASGMLSRIPIAQAILRWYTREQYARILEALRIVGLEDRVLDRCDRLSGGQKQRVAIARAIVQQPALILADEPISSLDPKSAKGVLEVLRRASREFGITVVCNLHHLEAAR